MRFNIFQRREAKANPIGQSLLVGGDTAFARWDTQAYIKEGYQYNPVVYMAVEEIAKAIAALQIEVYRGEDYVEKLPVYDLLSMPNPLMTGQSLIKAVFVDYLVTGEMAIAQPIGQKVPAELWPISSREIEVVPGRGGIPAAYIHRRNGQTVNFPVSGLVSPRADLFFFKRHNPTDYWRGMSPMAPAAIMADIHNRGSEWNNSMLKNGAKPSGIVSFEGDPSPDTVSRMKEWFKRAFQGSANAGEIPVLVGGAKFTQSSLSPVDMDFRESMTEAKKLIAGVYGIPLPLLDTGGATFANMEIAQEKFYTDTVIPLANEWLQAFGAWLLPKFGPDLSFKIDMDAIPALEAVRGRKADRTLKLLAAGILTIDEAREEIGYDPMTDSPDDAALAYGEPDGNAQ